MRRPRSSPLTSSRRIGSGRKQTRERQAIARRCQGALLMLELEKQNSGKMGLQGETLTRVLAECVSVSLAGNKRN
jgi:hypothetical protein